MAGKRDSSTLTATTPYSGSTQLGAIGVGNYGTTAAQLDTSGGSPYNETGEDDNGGRPTQWQVDTGDMSTFIGLSGAK